MTTKIKLAAAMLALAMLTCGGLYIKALRADNQRLAQSAAIARQEAAALQEELNANQVALAKREAERIELATQTETIKKELEAVYANDPKAASWACANLPDAILCGLQ